MTQNRPFVADITGASALGQVDALKSAAASHRGLFAQVWLSPRKTWLRRALFQIHLWTGIAVGLIATVVGVSGSAIVYKDALDRLVTPALFATTPERRLSADALMAAASRRHPGWSMSYVAIGAESGARPTPWIFYMTSASRPGTGFQLAYIDPATGRELGVLGEDSGLMNGLAALHFRLLAGPTGNVVNGIGAALLFLLCATGMVIWWPGRGRVRNALTIRTGARWPRLIWDVHNVFGFWSVLPLGIEAFTGVYYCFFVPIAAALVFLFGGSVARWQEMSVPPRSTVSRSAIAVPFEPLLQESLRRHSDCIVRGMSLPVAPDDPFTVQLDPPHAEDRGAYAQVAFDRYTGDVLSDIDSRNESFAIRAVLFIRPLHFGTFGGHWSRVAWIAVGLMPGLLFFTGFPMWWRRVPRRRLRAASSGKHSTQFHGETLER